MLKEDRLSAAMTGYKWVLTWLTTVGAAKLCFERGIMHEKYTQSIVKNGPFMKYFYHPCLWRL